MQQREWLHVEDNCSGILAALERGRIGEVYNIGGSDVEENLTMAKRVLGAMGKPETLLAFVKDRPGHDRLRPRLQQGGGELGWKRMITLDEGLRRTIEWYESIRMAGQCECGRISLYYESIITIAILLSEPLLRRSRSLYTKFRRSQRAAGSG